MQKFIAKSSILVAIVLGGALLWQYYQLNMNPQAIGLNAISRIDAAGYSNLQSFYHTLLCDWSSDRLSSSSVECTIQTQCGTPFEFALGRAGGPISGYRTDSAAIRGALFRRCPEAILDPLMRSQAEMLSKGG